MNLAEEFSQREARERLWEIGIIAPWYLKQFQLDIYERLLVQRFPFVEKSRRIGGTTTCLVRVLEVLRRQQEGIWRWMEPWKYQAREIIMPEMDRIQETCPERFKFKFYKTDSFYECPSNGSRLYLRGVNEDRGESARGSYAHGETADEYGSWRDASYVLNEVMLPQLLSTNGPLWRVSSPPRNLGHLYYTEREVAAREGRFIQKLIQDSVPELYTEEQVLQMCLAVGGPQSPAWLREFMCQPVSDPDMLIVPEWSDDENIVEDDYPRPAWPTFYMAGDSGLDDNTALLFGWYDFEKDEEVIEDDWIANGKTTQEIVDVAKAREHLLWGDQKPHRRAYDAAKQLIFDLFGTHDYPVTKAKNEDKHAAIHAFRVRVGQRKFKVKRRCAHTCRQLKIGMWKDEKHLDFDRPEDKTLGHFDAIAAAIIFSRLIDRDLNPVPLNHGVSHYTHFINPHSHGPRDKNEEALSAIFGGQRGRR